MRNTITYADQTFEGNSIKSCKMALDTSLNGRVLDVDTMSATISVKINDPLYFFTSEPLPFFTRERLRFMTAAQRAAFAPDIVQNTPVRFLRGGSQYALWYLARITRVAPDLYTLSMTSSLGRLTQMPHKGGIYNGVAASTIIDDICGVVPHFVGAAFQNVLLYGWLPYVAPSGENGAQTGSAKDNLLQVLFALNATVRDDADGTLRIENLSTAVSGHLGADRIYRDNASVVTEPTVTAVTVLEHQYITGSETTTLFEGTTVDGQVIVFREPMSNLTATGFTVTESNANYAVVSAGSGTLTGTPYIHTTREITKPVTAASIPNAVRIEDATLVGVTNSSDVVNRLVDYYRHRTYINVDATIDFEDAGDVVEIYDPFDKVLRQACIEKISPLVVSQTMKGRVSALVGFTPWQVVPFEDVRELLTGSGTWTVPADIDPGTEVQVVLIGAGEDGADGSPGTAPSGSWSNTFSKDGSVVIPTTGTSVSVNGSTSSSGSGAGVGGAGGAGGTGGKIFRSAIRIEHGQSFSFSCGDKNNDVNSVFGELSSANGASNPSGFYDSVTQTFYGVSGKAGLSGGNGGSAGSSGQDSGPVKGGSGVLQSSATKSSTSWIGNKTEIKLSASCTVGGVGGGGAGGSAGNNLGEQGANAGSTYIWTATTSAQDQGGYYNEYGSGRAQIQNVTSGKGGNGANGTNGATYGSGGDGGGGGGGAGACGSASLQATLNGIGHWWSTAAGHETYLSIYLSGIASSSSSGGAGTGGSGGAGAPGCIILYYRRPVTE